MDTLSDKKEKYDELYKTYHSIIEMQLSLSMDGVRAQKVWRTALSDIDVSVLSDVLAEVLNQVGHKILSCR
ncbi:hypothetical protein J6836_09635 [Providencia sp. R33]|uniref:hypothetical protein n=1 Tax=Providencia TaxID=586 RepID=UPI001C5B5665|nr:MULTISPECIES: hypothetical protein [Providencia]QXX84599.1 hypothetical protein J6836_09635 [Providencia sp. R33]